MIPKLFASTATAYTTQGIGALTDTILCYVEEERNGKYEGWLKYPITGIHYADIGMRSIIVCKPNYTDDPQPFRVYEISKPINGVVTVYFQHISYDLSGYPCQPFTASTLTAALSGLTANCPITCPFTLTSSRSVTATFTADVPASIRSWLGGKAGSLLDVYGGEWSYNGFTATLHTQRGANRGVTIRYGKNLTSLEQEENCSKVYTGVYPYWTDSYGGNLTQITGRIVHNTDTDTYAGATYDYDKILPIDLSNKWETQPTEGQIISAAKKYIEDNELGTPAVNLDVEFAQISNLIKDRVDLCDTVTVQFERLGVSATAKCIKTRWNVLLGRYEEITLGDAKTTIAETIVGTKETAERAVSKSSLEMAVDQATSLITGNSGGYVVLHDSDGDDKPDELLIMNTPSIDTATKVWRWNQAGLGYSSTGYSGTYGLAMTANGQIVADYVNTGTLNANVIKAGILQDVAGINSWNMETGEFNVQVSGTVQNVQTFYAESLYNSPPQWDYPKAYLYDTDGKALYDANGNRLVARQIWTTTAPTSVTSNYRWMRTLVTYKDGTTQLTSAVPMQDYYGRANLVIKASTDGNGRPIGILSGLADYMKFTAGQLEISSPQFTLDREGNASFSGAVTATSLTLGSGVNIDVDRVEGFADAATDVVEGTVTASFVNALGITARSVAAENITGTTLTGKTIVGGIIKYDDNNYWNLQTGEIRISSFANQFSLLNTAVGNTQAAVDALEVGIAVDNNGVTVGRQNAAVKGVFSNDSLEFQTSNGTPIAWLSSDASDGLGVDLIQIGSHTTANQRWIIKTNSDGSRLSFTRRAS